MSDAADSSVRNGPAAGPEQPTTAEAEGVDRVPGAHLVLLLSVFVVAACGLAYELLAGSLSTYLLGNSVMQFSLVIGLFLSAMGVGSFLSRFVTRRLLRTFILAEIAVGAVGGASALVLFFAFSMLDTYLPLLIGLSLVIGSLVGLEIPLLVRIVRAQGSLRAALGNVLALDYLGALAASLLFPLLLLPWLGLVRAGFFFGLLNLAVAVVGLVVFRHQLAHRGRLELLAAVVGLGLLLGLLSGGRATTWLEDAVYEDEVLWAETTPYQRLVLTRWRDDIRLFIDGNIQFSSADEFRYHEALVHPAMGLLQRPQRVLLLGAGDGMAAREVLKYPQVEQIDLVDLDPAMTRLFATRPMLVELNEGALSDPKVQVHNADAQLFLEQSDRRWDLIVMDLPDPNNESLGKLYTRSFFRLAAKHLTPRGILVTQATSPFYATDAYWCIFNTLAATTLTGELGRLHVVGYHVNVPSFGEWGFAMASPQPLHPEHSALRVPTRFLTPELLPTLFVFAKDIAHRDTPINRLGNQILVKLYESGYRRYNR